MFGSSADTHTYLPLQESIEDHNIKQTAKSGPADVTPVSLSFLPFGEFQIASD